MRRTSTSWQGDGDIGVNEHLASSWHGSRLRGVQIVARSKGAAASRQTSLVGQLLDLQRRALLELGHRNAGAAALDHGVCDDRVVVGFHSFSRG